MLSVSAEFDRQIDRATAALPEGVRQQVAAAGFTLERVPFVVDLYPDLRGQKPTGWRKDTYDQMPAVRRRKQIVIAESTRDRLTRSAMPVTRPTALLFHEYGHAFDLSFSGHDGRQGRPLRARAEFQQAWQSDCDDLRTTSPAEDLNALAYYAGQPTGLRETLAELFAELNGHPLSGMDLVHNFPRAAALMRQTLESVQ